MSTWKKDEGTAGQFTLTAGKWFGDEKQDMGIQTGPDARFYNTYATLDKPFDNHGKDLVLQVRSCESGVLRAAGGPIALDVHGWCPESIQRDTHAVLAVFSQA